MIRRVHGTAVHLPGLGDALIMGESGAGKSALALRLIQRGGLLIADDQTELVAVSDGIVARAPASIAGYLEIRGIGILRVPSIAAARIDAVFFLSGDEAPERLPERQAHRIDGMTPLPSFQLAASDPAAAEKLVAALAGLRFNLFKDGA